jgi:hypothetical protein
MTHIHTFPRRIVHAIGEITVGSLLSHAVAVFVGMALARAVGL